MEKYLIIKFNNGAKFQIDANLIAHNRAYWYANSYDTDKYEEIYSLTLNSDEDLLDWAHSHMEWKNVQDHATQLPLSEHRYEHEWRSEPTSWIEEKEK